MNEKFNLLKTKIRGAFLLLRFELPFSAGVSVIMGELLALGTLPALNEMLLGFLSVFCVSATALILNDYFDLESDRINAPQRPLPAGLVTERDAVVLAVGLALLGFVIGYIISVTAFLVVILVWGIGFLYNWKLKRTGFLGNLTVSLSVGMTFVFGGLVVGEPFEKIVWFFALLALLIDLGEEIAGDALDAQGDRLIGSRSLALLWGQENALKLSGAIFLSVIIMSGFPFIFGWLDPLYGLPLVIMDVGILYSTLQLLDRRKAALRRVYVRCIYLSGLLGMLLFLCVRMVR